MKIKLFHFINNFLYVLCQLIQIAVFSKMYNQNDYSLYLFVFFTSLLLSLYRIDVRDKINSYKIEYVNE